MVYCKIKERNDYSAVYSIGSRIDDMSGEITFFKGDKEPILNKQAEKYPVHNVQIARLLMKYMDDFDSGKFADKLSVEIG